MSVTRVYINVSFGFNLSQCDQFSKCIRTPDGNDQPSDCGVELDLLDLLLSCFLQHLL